MFLDFPFPKKKERKKEREREIIFYLLKKVGQILSLDDEKKKKVEVEFITPLSRATTTLTDEEIKRERVRGEDFARVAMVVADEDVPKTERRRSMDAGRGPTSPRREQTGRVVSNCDGGSRAVKKR